MNAQKLLNIFLILLDKGLVIMYTQGGFEIISELKTITITQTLYQKCIATLLTGMLLQSCNMDLPVEGEMMSNSPKHTNPIYSFIPSDKPYVRAAYQAWCETHKKEHLLSVSPKLGELDPVNMRVGIVGGGMAGLYSALLLKSENVSFHMFEAESERIGGRVYTSRFNDDKNQYFEAGAMRLPDIQAQQPVFSLINYLNDLVDPDKKIETMDYVLHDESGNNLVYVNGKSTPDGKIMTQKYAEQHPEELGFKDCTKPAQELLNDVIKPFLDSLNENFDQGFKELLKYDDYSLRAYLAQVEKWDEEKINYVETMTSATNQFYNSFTELVIENMDFSQAKWKTIKDGMCRLPEACKEVIGDKNITMGAKVYKISETEDGKVAVYHTKSDTPAIFDKVIAAAPPSVIRMWEKPQWSSEKEHAIRSLRIEPLYKIGLRFKSRFWEQKSTLPPSYGGQSTTDLPTRWFVYPSYGIKDDGPGVLLLYSWMNDAYRWLDGSSEEHEKLALRDLSTVYGEKIIKDNFIESKSVLWPLKWAQGDAMFLPGQFKNLFNVARKPENNIHFAGEHLSVHHTWILGALDSALLACKQVLGKRNLQPLAPDSELSNLKPHTYDYSKYF